MATNMYCSLSLLSTTPQPHRCRRVWANLYRPQTLLSLSSTQTNLHPLYSTAGGGGGGGNIGGSGGGGSEEDDDDDDGFWYGFKRGISIKSFLGSAPFSNSPSHDVCGVTDIAVTLLLGWIIEIKTGYFSSWTKRLKESL